MNAAPSNFAYIDLLLWQPRESGPDNWAQYISPAGRKRDIQLFEAPFSWNQGIRVGIGHEFASTSDITLILTHYNTSANDAQQGLIYSSFDANYWANNTNGSGFGPYYRSANIIWKFLYNTAGIELGHHFDFNSIVQIHPHIGIAAASINQNANTNWYDPVNASNFSAANEYIQNDFWGLGPTIGADTTWPIYHSNKQAFNLIGNIATGLYWGQWNFKDIYHNNAPLTINVKVDGVTGLSPMVQGLLGLEWSRHLTSSNISLRLSYEEQIWFNQIQYYSLNMGRPNRTLSLQGGSLELKYAC